MSDFCNNVDLLKVVYFARLIFDVIRTVIPLSLVVFGIIDFSKVLISGEGDKQKNILRFFKRILYAIVIFTVPWIVGRLIYILSNLTKDTVEFANCIVNATPENIQVLEVIQEQEEKIACYQCKTDEGVLEWRWGNYSGDNLCNMVNISKESCSGHSSSNHDDGGQDGGGQSSGGEVDDGSNPATGTLKSPINPKATQKEFADSIKDNSRQIYYLNGNYHGGTDLPGLGVGITPVYAMDSGVVYFVQDGCGSYGRHIILKHVHDGRVYYTIYAHLYSIENKYKTAGTIVYQGEKIAISGNSYGCPGDPNRATTVAPHLHIGIALENNQSSKFPQVAGDNSFLVGNFIGTNKKYSVVTSENMSEYKECQQYCTPSS